MKSFNILKKLNKDNKGMSLVEAIIAVGILSVAVIPVLACFSSTVRYNAVAKIKQRGTNTGMSVMESFKAYGLKDAHDKFADGSFLASAPADVTYTVPVSGYFGEYVINNVSFNDSASETDKKYTVKVTVDKYQDIKEADGIEGTPFYNPNNGVQFIEDPKDDFDPMHYIKICIDGNPNVDKDKVSDIKITREIHIDINGSGEVKITYKFKGTYDYSGAPRNFELADGNSIPDKSETLSCTNPSDLNNIFFYYYPAYDNRSDIKIKDEFFFSNDFKDDVNLYIFKQKDSSVGSIELKNVESFYKATFGLSDATFKLNVYDVVNQNIGKMDGVSMSIFDSFTRAYLSNIVLNEGMTSVIKDVPVSATIKVEVIDEKPIFNSNSKIVTLYGTVMM